MISIPGKIPIIISPFFWFLIIMLGWLNSGTLEGTAIWAVVILVSVLVHEYGHALTALLFGQTAEINLVGLGGLTKREGPKLPRWKEFVIVLDGPMAGLMLYFIANYATQFVEQQHYLIKYTLHIASIANLFWTILNLVPVFPLDGGHLLRILLEGAFGVRGLKIAFLLSTVMASIIGLFFFLSQQILMGALFFMLAFESYRAWADVKMLAPEDSDQKLLNLVREGMEDLKRGQLQEALAKFTYIRDEAPKGMLYVTATQYGARVLAEQGHLKKAYDWLFPIKNRLAPEYIALLQQLAYRIQEWEEAVKIGQTAYQQNPTIDTALINSLSYAIMGDATPAVGWLRCAVQQGLTDLPKVIEKREFDAIRGSKPFQTWLKSMGRS